MVQEFFSTHELWWGILLRLLGPILTKAIGTNSSLNICCSLVRKVTRLYAPYNTLATQIINTFSHHPMRHGGHFLKATWADLTPVPYSRQISQFGVICLKHPFGRSITFSPSTSNAI